MDKKKQLVFNLNGFLIPVSSALDSVQNYKKNTSLGHSKRVAYLALNIAVKLNFSPEQLFDLCAYSLCHNIALNNSTDEKSFCQGSDDFVKEFPFLVEKSSILKYQKEKYDGSGIFSLKGDEIPLFSQILSLAIFIDEKFDLANTSVKQRDEIIEFVKSNKNILFSKELVDIFLVVSSKLSFWLDLKNEQDLILFIYSSLHDFTKAFDFEDILKITTIFSKIENSNSKLIEFTKIMCEYYEFEHKDSLTLQIAASLSKIGKLNIDSQILQKKDPLDRFEKEEIKSYPYFTNKILSNIMGFNDIKSWAIKIQEKIDGSGYCFDLDGKNLSFKDRLLAILNIYDALRQEKVYRNAYTHEEAIEIMKKEAENKKIDISIVEDINSLLK